MTHKGLDKAFETTKQFIALSTGVIALTVTFADKFAPKSQEQLVIPLSLKLSWGAFGFTVVFGTLTMMAITGTIDKIDQGGDNPGAKATNIRIPALLMVLFFLAGLGLTIWAGISVAKTA